MTVLKNVVSFSGLVVGVPTALPHLLNVNSVPVLPGLVAANAEGFTVTANATNITVTRLTGAAAAVAVYAEHWHTIEEVFPVPGSPASFMPFIIASGGVSAGGVAQNGAMFYGTTTGTGSEGNDYAATVAVGANVPFPRDGASASPQATRATAATFTITTTGVYEISWQVGFTEASQLQLAVGGVGRANTCATSGAGTQQNSNTVIVALTAGNVISIQNPAGNATALTVTPSDGSLTHAQAPSLTVKQIG